jgi:hypothetical protein
MSAILAMLEIFVKFKDLISPASIGTPAIENFIVATYVSSGGERGGERHHMPTPRSYADGSL